MASPSTGRGRAVAKKRPRPPPHAAVTQDSRRGGGHARNRDSVIAPRPRGGERSLHPRKKCSRAVAQRVKGLRGLLATRLKVMSTGTVYGAWENGRGGSGGAVDRTIPQHSQTGCGLCEGFSLRGVAGFSEGVASELQVSPSPLYPKTGQCCGLPPSGQPTLPREKVQAGGRVQVGALLLGGGCRG